MQQKQSIFLPGLHVFALLLFESRFIVHIFRIFLWSNVETHVVYCSQITEWLTGNASTAISIWALNMTE